MKLKTVYYFFPIWVIFSSTIPPSNNLRINFLANIIKNTELKYTNNYTLGLKIGYFNTKSIYPQFLQKRGKRENIINENLIVSLGSISKSIVAYTFLKVSQNKIYKLNLNDNVSKWFPEYKKFHSYHGKKLKLFHLLSMSSGIEDYLSSVDFENLLNENKLQYISPFRLVNIVKNKKLRFAPGSQFSYSNTNYILIGMLLEKVTGKSLEKILENETFKALNLNSMILINKEIFKMNESYNYTVAYAAGAIVSNLSEVYTFLNKIFFDKDLQWYRNLITNEKYCTLISNSKYVQSSYCLGVFNSYLPNKKISFFSHAGQISNESLYFSVLPESKLTTIISLKSDNNEFDLQDLFFEYLLPYILINKII